MLQLLTLGNSDLLLLRIHFSKEWAVISVDAGLHRQLRCSSKTNVDWYYNWDRSTVRRR